MTLLNQGPVMWRCTNGAPNYRTSWWIRGTTYSIGACFHMPIYPVIVFTPWHKGCLSKCDELGTSSHSLTVGIEFWRWRVGFMLGRIDNVKTQAEIDMDKEVKP